MIKTITLKRISLLMLIVFMASACTSTSNLYNPNYINLSGEVYVGDIITVYTKSGKKEELIITEIQEERIIGSSKTIEFKDIERIKIIKPSNNKSFKKIGTIIIEVLIVIVAVEYFKSQVGFD